MGILIGTVSLLPVASHRYYHCHDVRCPGQYTIVATIIVSGIVVATNSIVTTIIVGIAIICVIAFAC